MFLARLQPHDLVFPDRNRDPAVTVVLPQEHKQTNCAREPAVAARNSTFSWWKVWPIMCALLAIWPNMSSSTAILAAVFPVATRKARDATVVLELFIRLMEVETVSLEGYAAFVATEGGRAVCIVFGNAHRSKVLLNISRSEMVATRLHVVSSKKSMWQSSLGMPSSSASHW
jgi:hypothetical protein